MRVDRQSDLGNPFPMGADGHDERFRDAVCEACEEVVREPECANVDAIAAKYGLRVDSRFKGASSRRAFSDALDALEARVRAGESLRLMCWCHPKRCHADGIIKVLRARLSTPAAKATGSDANPANDAGRSDEDSEDESPTQPTAADGQGSSREANDAGSVPDGQPSIRFMVAGSSRPATFDTGAGNGIRPVEITRSRGGALRNPFQIGPVGNAEWSTDMVCKAHAVWLELDDVPASAILPELVRGPRILQDDGSPFPAELAPRRTEVGLTGRMAKEAVQRELNDNNKKGARGAHTLRFECSGPCGEGMGCIGDNLAAIGRQFVANRDAKVAAVPPVKPRKVRKDKGTVRGPRALTGAARYRIGALSLDRFRFGIERQVSQATRASVLEGQRLGVKPWLMDSQDRQRRDEHERPDAGSQGSSSSSRYDGWQQQPESEDCSMEEPGDGATQESADCDMADEDSGSQQCQPEPGDEGHVDDAGWCLFESERSLGSDLSDDDGRDCMEDDDGADAVISSRRRRGKRNLSVRCR